MRELCGIENGPKEAKLLRGMVGLPGLEPGTSCTPSKRATRLRYSPNCVY